MTRQIHVGGIPIGGGAPVTIQSMTNTRTDDLESTLSQIRSLAAAGCQIVRVAVPDRAAARAVAKIKEASPLPVVVDIHFDYKLALEAIAAGADKVRINPGNIGGEDRVKAVADACRLRGIPIRIGVNGGSLEKGLLAKYGGVCPEAMVESAFGHIRLLNKFDFDDICVSLKSSSVPMTMRAYQLMREKSNYPVHIGVTEAGTVRMGTLKSAVGIGGLLALGIGDTIRVSLRRPGGGGLRGPGHPEGRRGPAGGVRAGLLSHLRADPHRSDRPGCPGGGAAEGGGQAHHGGGDGLCRQRAGGGVCRRLRDRGRHRRRPPVPKRGDREKGPPGPAGGRAVCPDRGTVTQGALHHPTD